MSKKIKYTNEPMKMGERVADFLPPPSKLVKRENTVKATLELKISSSEFGKEAARQAKLLRNRPEEKEALAFIEAAWNKSLTRRTIKKKPGGKQLRIRKPKRKHP